MLCETRKNYFLVNWIERFSISDCVATQKELGVPEEMSKVPQKMLDVPGKESDVPEEVSESPEESKNCLDGYC